MTCQAAGAGAEACVFDAYGTLFDVHSTIGALRERLGPEADAVSRTWRTKQLEYTWLRSLMRRHADFLQVTREALDYALALHGVSDSSLQRDLMQAYFTLASYPDVRPALQQLKERGLQLAILSNGSPEMLAAAVRHGGLDRLIDMVLSVEEVGIYKPDPRVYQLAVERLGYPAREIAFLSANAWDIAGAASFGLRALWVNRFGHPPEQLPYGAEAEITTLAGLPALLGLGPEQG